VRVARFWGAALVLLTATTGAFIATELRISPENALFTFFVLLAVVVPVVALLYGAVVHKFLDVLAPWALIPLTFGLIYSTGPTLLLQEGSSALSRTVATALALGIISYYIGAILVRLAISRGASVPPSFTENTTGGSSFLRTRILAAAFVVGVVAMLAYWARAGGVPMLKGDLENSRVEALSGSGVPFYLSMLLMVATWLAWSPEARLALKSRILLTGVAAGLLLSTGWRNTVFALLAVTILSLHYTRAFKTALIAWGGILIVLGAVFLGLNRVVSSDLSSYQAYRLLMSGDVIGAGFTYLANYADAFSRNLSTVFTVVPSSLPFQGGSTIWWNFESLISGSGRKPFDFILKEASGQGFAGGGLPATLIGEWFINFGWAGIVCGMALVGAIASIAHHHLRSSSNYLVRLIAVLVLYYVFVAVRGGIGNVMLTIVWLILCAVVLNYLASSRPSVRGPKSGPSSKQQTGPVRRLSPTM
jgi:oligosaccharide repeat unit polymerase